MKILMLYPRFFEPTFWNPHRSGRDFYGKNVTMAPLGFLTIASYLPDDFQLRLVDRNVAPETAEDWAWADVVFLSLMSVQRDDYRVCVDNARAHGKLVAVGGPYTHNSPEQVAADADWVCFGEAEDIMEAFVADLRAGARPRQYQGGSKTNMERVRVPRFDLLPDVNAYADMPVQFSRGCPFNCEFCDIIEIYGRVPRAKPPEHLLAELDALKRLGFVGSVFIVDDNFIGNKRLAKAMLEKLAVWNEDNGWPFVYMTEASLNLADEPQLLEAMERAGLSLVFIGIETPDPALLKLMQKRQNLVGESNPLEKLQRIRNHGVHIIAGLVLGFDGEDEQVFDAQRAFIDASGIGVPIVNLLSAIPHTQLSRRLTKEGRLLGSVGKSFISSFEGINFIPRGSLTKRKYLEEYARLMREIFEPRTAFARSLRGLMAARFPRRKHSWAFYRLYTPAFFRLLYHMGSRAREFRRPFWRTLLSVAFRKPTAIDAFFFDAMFLYHLHPFAEHLAQELSRYVASPADGDVLDECLRTVVASPSAPVPISVQLRATAEVA